MATGTLVTVEGLDGAGKNTLTRALTAGLEASGLTVATCAFPRYGSLHADLAADALHGRPGTGPIADSAVAMATLFALDRHAAAGELDRARAAHDVVLCDRHVASNVAYTAARQGLDALPEVAAWIEELEFGRFGAARPDLQLLLATPTELAARRAADRAAGDPGRARDRYERDARLQADTGAAYARLAARHWGGPWTVLGPEVDPAAVCTQVTDLVAG